MFVGALKSKLHIHTYMHAYIDACMHAYCYIPAHEMEADEEDKQEDWLDVRNKKRCAKEEEKFVKPMVNCEEEKKEKFVKVMGKPSAKRPRPLQVTS